jgi:hypothetical protein
MDDMMSRDEALAELQHIITGIDANETDGGWWETSTGVEFGRSVKAQLVALVERLTIDQ